MKCNKKKYDHISAMLALAKVKHLPEGKRMERRQYFCNFCKAFHLTSELLINK